jgi:hypothetical protein
MSTAYPFDPYSGLTCLTDTKNYLVVSGLPTALIAFVSSCFARATWISVMSIATMFGIVSYYFLSFLAPGSFPIDWSSDQLYVTCSIVVMFTVVVCVSIFIGVLFGSLCFGGYILQHNYQLISHWMRESLFNDSEFPSWACIVIIVGLVAILLWSGIFSRITDLVWSVLASFEFVLVLYVASKEYEPWNGGGFEQWEASLESTFNTSSPWYGQTTLGRDWQRMELCCGSPTYPLLASNAGLLGRCPFTYTDPIFIVLFIVMFLFSWSSTFTARRGTKIREFENNCLRKAIERRCLRRKPTVDPETGRVTWHKIGELPPPPVSHSSIEFEQLHATGGEEDEDSGDEIIEYEFGDGEGGGASDQEEVPTIDKR